MTLRWAFFAPVVGELHIALRLNLILLVGHPDPSIKRFADIFHHRRLRKRNAFSSLLDRFIIEDRRQFI